MSSYPPYNWQQDPYYTMQQGPVQGGQPYNPNAGQAQTQTPAPLAAPVTLAPYNNIALAATTATQLLPPAGGGRYNLTLIATAAGVFIKNANTVSSTDAASFPLPANIPVTIVISNPAGIWVLATAAGNLGALLTPRGE